MDDSPVSHYLRSPLLVKHHRISGGSHVLPILQPRLATWQIREVVDEQRVAARCAGMKTSHSDRSGVVSGSDSRPAAHTPTVLHRRAEALRGQPATRVGIRTGWCPIPARTSQTIRNVRPILHNPSALIVARHAIEELPEQVAMGHCTSTPSKPRLAWRRTAAAKLSTAAATSSTSSPPHRVQWSSHGH